MRYTKTKRLIEKQARYASPANHTSTDDVRNAIRCYLKGMRGQVLGHDAKAWEKWFADIERSTMGR